MPTQASWKIGDAVLVCVQAPEFERLQTCPFGGWSSDMIQVCGKTGLIIDRLTSPLRFVVKFDDVRNLVINPVALSHVETKTREDEETSKSVLAVLPKIFKSIFTWDFVKEIVQDKAKDVVISACLTPFGIHGPVKTIVVEVITGVCHVYYSAVVEKKTIDRSFLTNTVKDVFGGVVKKLGMDIVVGDVFGKAVLDDLDDLADVVEAATNVAEEEEKTAVSKRNVDELGVGLCKMTVAPEFRSKANFLRVRMNPSSTGDVKYQVPSSHFHDVEFWIDQNASCEGWWKLHTCVQGPGTEVLVEDGWMMQNWEGTTTLFPDS